MNVEICSDVDSSSAESQSQIGIISESSSNGSYSSSVSEGCLPSAFGVQYQKDVQENSTAHTTSVELRSHFLRPKPQVHHTMNVQNCSDGDSSSAGSRLQVGNISGSSSDGSYMRGVSDRSQSNAFNSQHQDAVLETSMPSCCKEYVDITTMKIPNRCSGDGARVLSKLLPSNDHIFQLSLLQILENMQKESSTFRQSEVIKFLSVQKLPSLSREKRLADIALCLLMDDTALQSNACFTLEKILLQLQQSQDKSLTRQLVDVTERTQQALLKLNDDDEQVLNMASLHLMTVSAIFTRCEKPDLELCSSFVLSPKANKKVASGWMKQTVFKSLKQFYDHFKEEVKELSSPPSWTDIVTAAPEQDLIKDKSSRASCFKLVMYAFSILNEMAKHGWMPLSLKLLNALKKMHENTDLKTGKYRISQESKAMFDFFIIRSLVVLLHTIYVEDREPFGDSKYEHQKCISQIITGVIQSCSDNSSQKERLLREVRSLMFHKARSVRQTFESLYRNVKMSLKDLASGHIEYCLRGFGFRRDEARDINSEGRQAITGTCSWNVSPSKLCDVKTDCAMYLPTVNCMAEQDYHVGACLDHHPSKHGKESATRSEMHKQNLKMLQRLSPKSDHVLKLLAYQYKPFPFYITEAVEEEDRLLSYLCLHRKEGHWLDTKTIAKIVSQIVDIVILLENEGIATRDLTCYNLVVRKYREDQEEKSRCQVLHSTENYIIQLADLSLTHCYRNNGDICIVRDHGPIPVRWTAPEALFDGRYSLKSMVWQIGCVMYEIATYGCEPYTSYNMATDDILKKMNKEPGSIKLFPWPCAPKAIRDMVEKCTNWNPEDRPSLESLKGTLQRMEDAAHSVGEEMSLEEALIMETQYPSPSSRQTQRSHVPEKGIPPSVQELITARKDSLLYRGTRTESWHKESCMAIKEGELVSDQWIQINVKGDRTIVKEKLSQKFTNGDLRLIESSKLPVKCWVDGEQGMVRLSQHDGQPVHEREYHASTTLKTAVITDELSTTNLVERSKDAFVQRCLHVLVSAANSMCELHSQRWLIRDIQASTILVDYHTGEAVFARISRMCHLRETQEQYVDKAFPDCWRRLAPEVLVANTYSYASDVFTFATMVWEVFNARDIIEITPNARIEDFEPCADISRDSVFEQLCKVADRFLQVLSFVRENTELPRPELCPQWLHSLILECRHSTPSKRPTADKILSILRQHLSRASPPKPFLTKDLRDPAPENRSSEATTEKFEAQTCVRKKVGTILGSIRKRFATKKDLKSENLDERHHGEKAFTKYKRWKSTNHNQREVKVPQVVPFHEGNAPHSQKDTKSAILNCRDSRRDFCAQNSASQNVILRGTLESEREYMNSEVSEDRVYDIISSTSSNDGYINVEVNGCFPVFEHEKPCSDAFKHLNETSLQFIASSEHDGIHLENNGCSSLIELEQSRNETFEDRDETIPKVILSSAETENFYSSLCLPELGNGNEYNCTVSRSSCRQLNDLSPTADDEMEHQMTLLEHLHEESSISKSENKNRVARSRSQLERTWWSIASHHQITPLASLSRNIGRRRVWLSPSLKKRKTFSGRSTRPIKRYSSSLSACQSDTGCRNRDSSKTEYCWHCDDLRERNVSSRKEEATVMFVADDPCVCNLIYNTRQLLTRRATHRKHTIRHVKDKGKSSMTEICGEENAFTYSSVNPDDPDDSRTQEFHGTIQEIPNWEVGTICAIFKSSNQKLEEQDNIYDDCDTSCEKKELCEDEL